MLRLMDKIVLAQLRYEVFTYIQDLLIISDSVEQQLEVPSIVASHLTRENLTINVEKCKFCRREVNSLWHVFGHGTISTDPDKIAVVKDLPTPRSVKQWLDSHSKEPTKLFHQKFSKIYSELCCYFFSVIRYSKVQTKVWVDGWGPAAIRVSEDWEVFRSCVTPSKFW